MRQADRRFERLVEQHHPMVLLEHRRHTAHHLGRFLFTWLGDLDHLEAPGEGRILLDVALAALMTQVVAAAVRACRARAGFQEVGGIAGARGTACPRSRYAPRPRRG